MNSQLPRRAVLLSSAAVTLGLAGCSSDSDPSGSSGGDTDSWQEILNTRETVQEDEYQAWNWSADQSTEIRWEFTVRNGPEAELFVMESTEFDEFQAGNRFYAVESAAGTSDETTFTVESGDYRFVLDNTNAGDIAPPTNLDDDAAEIELVVEARTA
ncbi:hypothetical protein NDI56_05850 [Haloarcula sp. S1CR25-12]|uniref:Lipoprotein n=1 Tax=Haloarcula saliterrae TaxID=2950534 RepID=A0ABU2F9I2_9EURY|nr:hypothetical protein [Haloarcula sp. S1CR25-12]MDS0258914.1 hypothetical protein [Haloarcula sp. S1CR25-12]